MLKLCLTNAFLDTFSSIFQTFGQYDDMCTINNRKNFSAFFVRVKSKSISVLKRILLRTVK